LIKSILSILQKEILSEFRTRYAISTVALFILTTVVMIVFSTAGEKLNTQILTALLWVIMFFGAMTALAKSFVSEEERGTSLLLQIISNNTSIFFGKLIFNIILSISINFFAVFLMLIFFNDLLIKNYSLFFSVLLLSSIAIASSTTLISALIAKANSKNALFPILSFPILLPIILLGVELTVSSINGIEFKEIYKDINLIISYSGLLILVSYYLFDYVWKD